MGQPQLTMAGKVCLITGANSGLGKATALGLARMGAQVVMVCRNARRGEAARADIIRRSDNTSVDLMLADLCSQQSIRQLAAEYQGRYSQLHVLVNNAGLQLRRRAITADGLETTFAVNHLAPFLLTHLLLDVLKASAPGRVVNVNSNVHHDATLDLDDLQGEKRYDRRQAYARSKLANVLFTYELARRLEGAGVTVNCLHPGLVRTRFARNGSWRFRLYSMVLGPFVLKSPAEGAETVIFLASSPEVDGVSGRYFVDKRETRSSEETYDQTLAQRLWQVSAQLTGLNV